MTNFDEKDKKKRLEWQCRRGMLEIDIVLKRYLSNKYMQASPDKQQAFESLLSENDQQLFLWITGKETPSKPYFALFEDLLS